MSKTNFQLVAAMNEAFGNPRGDWGEVNIGRVTNQVWNIFDEFCEALVALGYQKDSIRFFSEDFKRACNKYALTESQAKNLDVFKLRDALCDINVFSYGGHHILGYNADHDMRAVLEGVMTRFIKDENDREATIAIHAAKGVTQVYFEGEYPTMIMKSAAPQPDAPVGKFLKSASYQEPVFEIEPTFELPLELVEDGEPMLRAFAETFLTGDEEDGEHKERVIQSVLDRWEPEWGMFTDNDTTTSYCAFKAGLRFAGALK